jgi:LysM repeat protein
MLCVLAMASRRSPARWLAPIALLACAVAVYTVVHGGLQDTDAGSSSKSAATATNAGQAKRGAKRKRRYVVKAGDTLSAISIKTGVPLETIQRLNPGLDAQTLRTGQKVKLRR